MKNAFGISLVAWVHRDAAAGAKGLVLVEPLGYLDFLALTAFARLVLTDSGGIQEETTYLGIPCLTLRENTERPVTIDEGTNRLVRPETLLLELDRALTGPRPVRRPDLWDGHTATRCLEDLRRRTGPARLPVTPPDPGELTRLYSGAERCVVEAQVRFEDGRTGMVRAELPLTAAKTFAPVTARQAA